MDNSLGGVNIDNRLDLPLRINARRTKISYFSAAPTRGAAPSLARASAALVAAVDVTAEEEDEEVVVWDREVLLLAEGDPAWAARANRAGTRAGPVTRPS
jgi:hypothetical protein